MQSYLRDFSGKRVRALERGDGPVEFARRFEVSRGWVHQVRERLEKTEERRSFQVGHRRSRLADSESVLRAWIAAEPDLTLAELQERLAQQGLAVKVGALWYQLN